MHLSKRVGHLESTTLGNIILWNNVIVRNQVILSPSAALRTGSAKDLTLSFYAKGKGTFGERFKLTLVPSTSQGASK